MAVSPTAEGFRAAFRRPPFTLAEIIWRWAVGAMAAALFLFGLIEYVDSLPVTLTDSLFLRTRQPYLVTQAIAHILSGSLTRVVASAMLAALLLTVFWIVSASMGRMVTVRALVEYFREDRIGFGHAGDGERDVASNVSTSGSMRGVVQLSFLRAAVGLAAVMGIAGAAIFSGLVASGADAALVGVLFLFIPVAAFVCAIWFGLNWMLSLAAIFAVRDGEDAVGALSGAAGLCRERAGAVFAVSAWTWILHATVFSGTAMVMIVCVSFGQIVPWRTVVLGETVILLAYFVVADWLYMVRLAGYICIAEMPEFLVTTPPAPVPPQTNIDRDELILSDVPAVILASS
jgi:hypothetical protein